MSGGLGIIIGMATIGIGSAITETILISSKPDIAKYCDITAKCLIGATCVTCIAKFIKAVLTLA